MALALFADKGYEATSMREIAEQLGMTKPALYYHFGGKEDIVRTLLVDIETQVGELVTWAYKQPVDGQLRRRVLERWTDIMQAHGITAFRFVAPTASGRRDKSGSRRDGESDARPVPTARTAGRTPRSRNSSGCGWP